MEKKVSIIMGIYNCEDTLEESIESILNQTYQDWELIMCDDGSMDSTFAIANEFSRNDERIIVMKNEQNLGLAKALNHCLKHCTGQYIMRHDGDDLMATERIEEQVEYMNTHECDVCGSGAFLFDKDGVWGIRQPPKIPSKNTMVLGAPFLHPTVMMKHEKLLEVGGYSENDITKQRLEDYDLWMKFFEKGFILHNIQKPLIYFRENKESYDRKSRRFRIAETKARLEACRRLNISYVRRILALKPLLVMLMPKVILRKYHMMKSSQRKHMNAS